MGGEVLSKSEYEMPHGSYHDVIINNWRLPYGIPSYAVDDAKIGLFRYHSDWNCLIPVFEAIEKIDVDQENYRVITHKNKCIIEAQLTVLQPSTMWHIHLQEDGDSKIEAAYNAAVAFIQWFNKLIKNEQRRK